MSNKKKILIVDDEQDQRSWMATFFEDNGFETITAVDGQEGFVMAQEHHPDLITLDISMDNESGIRMFRNLQESPETASIPVAMVTGVSPDFKRYIESHKRVRPPAAYFEKPVDRDRLLKTVRELTAQNVA
ncbi:MAG: response regulator [candidate division Zixibacteria bacterium]|nr:response regulator [candidate division Zixibacteria bacterium]